MSRIDLGWDYSPVAEVRESEMCDCSVLGFFYHLQWLSVSSCIIVRVAFCIRRDTATS